VPPLRERKEDIAVLAAHFIELACRRFNRVPMQPTAGEIRQLQNYEWPGNVRELQNVIERAVITAQHGALHFEVEATAARTFEYHEAPTEPASSNRTEVFTDEEMRQRERDNILAALHNSHGRVYGHGGAAELLGLKPTTLNARIKKFGLKHSA
jgi:transcriptional regulator with GAF, ATPase, and Fis domain